MYTADAERIIEWVFGDLQGHVASDRGDQVAALSGGQQGSVPDGRSPAWAAAPPPQRTSPRIWHDSSGLYRNGRLYPVLAYREAKRLNALGASAVQSFDPQKQRIDPAILTLRPRFAPPDR